MGGMGVIESAGPWLTLRSLDVGLVPPDGRDRRDGFGGYRPRQRSHRWSQSAPSLTFIPAGVIIADAILTGAAGYDSGSRP